MIDSSSQLAPQQNSARQQAKTIQTMFSSIADRYDFLNRLLSFGIDIYWRRQCVAFIKNNRPFHFPILDLASGTGDLALAIEKALPGVPIVAADFSVRMLQRFQVKKPRTSQIRAIAADGTCLPFKEQSFEGVMIGFGIRNFTQRKKALMEIHRILKRGGILAILEFSLPENRLFCSIYSFYFEKVLPFVGGLFSERSAYRYLPESVKAFPEPATFAALIGACRFSDIHRHSLTGGIATLYTARKAY